MRRWLMDTGGGELLRANVSIGTCCAGSEEVVLALERATIVSEVSGENVFHFVRHF